MHTDHSSEKSLPKKRFFYIIRSYEQAIPKIILLRIIGENARFVTLRLRS